MQQILRNLRLYFTRSIPTIQDFPIVLRSLSSHRQTGSPFIGERKAITHAPVPFFSGILNALDKYKDQMLSNADRTNNA